MLNCLDHWVKGFRRALPTRSEAVKDPAENSGRAVIRCIIMAATSCHSLLRPCLRADVDLENLSNASDLVTGNAPDDQQTGVLQGLQVVFAPTAPADEARASLRASAEGSRDNSRGAGDEAAQTGGGSGAASSAAQVNKPRRFGRGHKTQAQPQQRVSEPDQRQQQAAEPSAGDVSCIVTLAEALSAGQSQQVAVAMLRPAPHSEGAPPRNDHSTPAALYGGKASPPQLPMLSLRLLPCPTTS